jgi:very-short-patch-repair endonuclease
MTARSDAFNTAASVAGRQHGALAVTQLRACGLTARDQRALVGARRLEIVEPTVLVVPGSSDTWFRRLQIGLLALGDGAFVSHEAAAALHGLDGSEPGAMVFTVPRTRRRPAPNGTTVHTTTQIGSADVLLIGGFRCSSATRTVLDLAASGAPVDQLAAAIDSAMRKRLSAPLVLVERLTSLRGGGRHGVRVLDRLLLDTGGESVLERRFLTLIRQAGLPRPETQRRIRSDGRHVARVDFLYPAEAVVVEVSGRLGHSNPQDRTRDAQRLNELQDLGYAVYEYTWGDLNRRPAYVVATLGERLRRRNTPSPSPTINGVERADQNRSSGSTPLTPAHETLQSQGVAAVSQATALAPRASPA